MAKKDGRKIMAIYRCKMCGGDLEVQEGASSCTCEFCGTQQTMPTVKDEGLQTLFNRANVLRMKSEFDRAAEVYEKILQKNDKEAEAYWGLILCKYGIEYVEDPETFKRIPTCHRASYDAVVSDEDYKNAIACADAVQRKIYEEEATKIDQIQRGIIALARKEDPYDVFICYKETDENGKRTQDSVIANDIYYQLTHEGFKVFYAAITLEDKIGTEYEPYIFSALNTAKVMLALGTKPEYFNAVWVKNEWSRFLKIMKKDRSKMLIPCYRDMDPYELPEEFAHLQAQDMSKIGFINDIVRGIKKVIVKENDQNIEQEATGQAVVYTANITALLKRGDMALEDKEWSNADGFFEEVLNQDAECSAAYLGKLMAKNQKSNIDELFESYQKKYENCQTERLQAPCVPDTEHIDQIVEEYKVEGSLSENSIRSAYVFDFSYDAKTPCRKKQKEKQKEELSSERLLNRAQQYATGSMKRQIENGLCEVMNMLDERIAQAQKDDEDSIDKVKKAYSKYITDADKKVKDLSSKIEAQIDGKYQAAVKALNEADTEALCMKAMREFKSLGGYKDSEVLVQKCDEKKDKIHEQKRKIEAERMKKGKRKENIIVGVVICIIILALFKGCSLFLNLPNENDTSDKKTAIEINLDEKMQEAEEDAWESEVVMHS